MNRLPLAEFEDLSGSLRNINRARAASRARCANDPVTRALIDAGIRLLQWQFARGDGRAVEDDDLDRDLLRFVSQRRVVREAEREWPEIGVTMPKFRNRWTSHQYYVADLIRFALTDRQWSLRVAIDQAENILSNSAEFASAVHRIALADLADSRQPEYRFKLVAATMAERDPVVRAALADMYHTLTVAWAEVYRATLEGFGVKLRPGITYEMLTKMISATAEGTALRVLSDHDSDVISPDGQTSMLGTAAIAIVSSVIDPGDGRDIESLLNDTIAAVQQQTRQAG
ncbi:MAG: hypothetical protein WAS07_08630 [Micropruina sp.]